MTQTTLFGPEHNFVKPSARRFSRVKSRTSVSSVRIFQLARCRRVSNEICDVFYVLYDAISTSGQDGWRNCAPIVQTTRPASRTKVFRIMVPARGIGIFFPLKTLNLLKTLTSKLLKPHDWADWWTYRGRGTDAEIMLAYEVTVRNNFYSENEYKPRLEPKKCRAIAHVSH
jgi:hypothetical protein